MASNALTKRGKECYMEHCMIVPIASNTQTIQFSVIFKMRISIFIQSYQVDFLFQNKVLELEHLLEEHDDVEQEVEEWKTRHRQLQDRLDELEAEKAELEDSKDMVCMGNMHILLSPF